MSKVNRLVVPVYDANLIDWEHKEGRVEASTLTRSHHDVDAQVWADACDVGFIVRSARTGNEILFTLETVGDNDGEVTHWLYRGYGPGSEDFTVTVFND